MLPLSSPHRWATPNDATAMAALVNIAGEGLPLYLWTQLAEPDESPWQVGMARARRESGSFSYRNTVVREVDGHVAACLISYGIDDNPPAVDWSAIPPMFVPLQELENQVPGTWYVNVLATSPQYRGRGYGRDLLAIADTLARRAGKRGLSIIVADSNRGARRLYERQGYQEQSQRRMVKAGWQGPGDNWVLLVKTL